MVVIGFATVTVITPVSFSQSLRGQAILHDGVLAPLFCALIWALCGTTALSRVLSSRSLVLLGNASYGLYLIHVPVQHIVRPAMLRMLEDKPHGEYVVLYFACTAAYYAFCIAASVVGYYWIETPARQWITNTFGRRRENGVRATVTVSSVEAEA